MNIEDRKSKSLYVAIVILSVALVTVGSFFYFGSRASKSLEVQPPSDPPGEIKLLFLGDMMFDRWIRQVGEKKGYDFIFQSVDDSLKGNDLIIGNLEGPITDNKSVSTSSEFGAKNNFIFTFDPKTARALRDHNINLVSLGNNHILNFGQNGLEQTEKYLTDAGMDYFCTDNKRYQIYNFDNFKIGFICYNQFEKESVERAKRDIGEIRGESDVVILYAHWGKEYDSLILRSIREIAHQFVDSGADLIIGSHPHVVQEKEEYKGKIIYYSLGNFIFDQYFDPDTARGLAVKATIGSDNSISFQEFSVEMKNNGQTKVIGN